MNWFQSLVIAACLMAAPAIAQVAATSTYSCNGLDAQQKFAAVEGAGGVFYRVHPDLHMFNAFSEVTADRVAALSAALAAQGTTLVFVPVPTKSLAMPDQLPQAARDYGYDATLAATVYLETVKKLQKRGVAVVDARLALHAAADAKPSFFLTDYRMTASGAERQARAIADVITATKGFADLPKGRFEVAEAGSAIVESAMRSALQRHCLLPLPLAETATYSATQMQAAAVAKGNTIFGGGGGRVAIVGTEIDGDAVSGLAGFVAKYTGLDTVQYAVTGGGAFAAISSYMTSAGFAEARPAYLVWAVPVQDSLANFGDQPFAELTAAAGDTCRVPLPVMANPQGNSVVADLASLDATQSYTLLVEVDNPAAGAAQFDFTSGSGMITSKSIYRSKDQVRTGRFFMPMSGLPPEGARTVEIRLDAAIGNTARVTACFN
jgi:alginate biosynthesis protein AlgX